MKRTYLFLILIWITAQTQADIAPNPIQAKGISARFPTEIKMTYEKVSVSLTLDSSYVHCYFRLHNEGKAEKIQIGYPVMSTSPYTLSNSRFAPIQVYQDGIEIKNIDRSMSNSRDLNSSTNSWYLWDSFLNEDETMEIEISYSLPHGIVKNDLYYNFDYLLSTGSGWKGKIDTAEVIVTLKNFDKKLILKTSPENYSTIGSQLIWKLYNIEPSTKDDISIKYEKKLGQYDEELKRMTLFILDEESILNTDIRLPNNLDSLNPKDIIYMNVLRKNEQAKIKMLDVDLSNGAIIIYTKNFIPKKLVETLNSKLTGFNNEKIEAIPLPKFIDKYSVELNGKRIDKKDLSIEVIKMSDLDINRVTIKKINKKNFHISIWTNK
jgi:hypothetical protein